VNVPSGIGVKMSDDMLELTPTELHAAYMAGVSLDAYVKARRVVQSPLTAVNMLAQGISSSEIEDYSYRMGCSNLTDRVLDALKSDLDTLSYLRFNHFSRPELSHEQIVDLMKRGVTTEFANSVSRWKMIRRLVSWWSSNCGPRI